MKIQIVANCQARPISREIAALAPDVTVLDPIILHLSKADDAADHAQQFDQADIIFAQLTADTFQPTHLSAAQLRLNYRAKTIIWPNIFYSGQQPYLRYFTNPDYGRLMGPLEALHDIRLHSAWCEHATIHPNSAYNSDTAFEARVRRASLDSLKTKEVDCDVVISDEIEKLESTARLFYTFNHPTQILLNQMAVRLLQHASISFETGVPRLLKDSLDRYQVPSSWSSKDMKFQGDQYTILPSGLAKIVPGKPKMYDLNDLCKAFEEVYNSHEIYRNNNNIRLTPNLNFT